jgi:hypothetical protein
MYFALCEDEHIVAGYSEYVFFGLSTPVTRQATSVPFQKLISPSYLSSHSIPNNQCNWIAHSWDHWRDKPYTASRARLISSWLLHRRLRVTALPPVCRVPKLNRARLGSRAASVGPQPYSYNLQMYQSNFVWTTLYIPEKMNVLSDYFNFHTGYKWSNILNRNLFEKFHLKMGHAVE